MTDIRELLEKYSNEVKIASASDKVYKDECVYTYDTPESENGIFVCLKSFIGVSKSALPLHFQKTQSHLYLKMKTFRREKLDESSQNDEPEKKKPSKLAIGVEGGFGLDEKQFYFEHEYSLFVYPDNNEIKLGSDGVEKSLNEKVQKSISSIINAESAALKEELANQAGSWDGELRLVSKHSSNILQLANPVQISPDPNSWKCEQCDVNKNLWLNLTDGKILCGRRQLDGSGGNNHAVEYYAKSKYPLAVKLGTITAKGADVYSYDEDDMVEDANLAVHLAHFGINMSKMEKTDKTMAELEIDLNQRVGEWDRIQEVGSKLVAVYGPGYTGMRNLGNSCYMNSVMQVLFTVPDFVKKYVNNRESYVRNAQVDPSFDFNLQMSKLGSGLLSGDYSKDPSTLPDVANILRPPKGIKPTSFKTLIGRGHVEFSTKRQQDSHEFLIYLLSQIERHLRSDTTPGSHINPCDSFKFKLEERIECTKSKQVRYKYRDELCLSLPIAKEDALNKEKVKEFEERKANLEKQGLKLEPGDLVRPEIRLLDCVKLFKQDGLLDNFYSSAVKSNVNAIQTVRLATFPEYLLVQAKKFEYASDWSPTKLNVSLQVPDTLDISELRGTGLKAGEVELVDEDPVAGSSQSKHAGYELNEAIVSQLMDMGFPLEGCKRAVYNTRETNDYESAANWACTHMEDSDFSSPFALPTQATKKETKPNVYNEESLNSIISMGFTKPQAIKALDATDNNIERAIDWIFSHTDELMEATSSDEPTTATINEEANKSNYRDGSGVYKLVAFISHMGTNANVGHYVAHILKDDKWVIYNDENVSLSENPPKDLAYLYFYKRV